MAKFAVTYGYLSVASNDLSSYCTDITLTLSGDAVDVTGMSSAAWREHVAGLRGWEVSASAVSDVAASALDSILWSLYMTSVSIEVRATGAAVGSSNPKWTGSAILIPGTVIGGSVGSASSTSFMLTGTGALTRATS